MQTFRLKCNEYINESFYTVEKKKMSHQALESVPVFIQVALLVYHLEWFVVVGSSKMIELEKERDGVQ